MVEFAIGLWGTPQWTNGDIPAILESVRIAEESGIDAYDAGDHLAFHPDAVVRYNASGGRFSSPEEPFFEPIVMLAGIASVTKRMRLATTILLAPLRPALLLAKQAATLDVLCGGRFDLGIGVGWQPEEYAAAGASWETRFAYFDELIQACRALWTNAPATYHGKLVNIDGMFSKPFPIQKGGVPIWLGVNPTERSFRRIAELGDGWLPNEPDPEILAKTITAMRGVVAAHGRDPMSIKIRARPPIIRDSDGNGDLDATLANVPKFIKAGAGTMVFSPFAYCKDPEDFESVIRKIASAKE